MKKFQVQAESIDLRSNVAVELGVLKEVHWMNASFSKLSAEIQEWNEKWNPQGTNSNIQNSK